MKTSSILLALIAVITLTGMVATDVLLKQQYNKVDWKNPYQDYEKRSLPTAKHWVIEGTPTEEIIIEGSSSPQVWLTPKQAKFYRIQQQGDTVFVAFTPDYAGEQSQPRDAVDRKLYNAVVLRLPGLQTLRIKNGRLTLSELTKDKLSITLQNSRLRTHKLAIAGAFDLTASQNSFAVLGPDRYGSLQTVIQDSSGVQMNDTQAITFTKQLSPKAEIQLRGQALKWLK